MSTEVTKKDDAEIKDQNHQALVSIPDANGDAVNVADLLAQIEDAEVGLELGADYFKIEAGEVARVVFIEMTEMNGMGDKSNEMIDAVRLLGPDGRYKVNADKVLVSACRILSSKGRTLVPLQITCKGMVKTKNGKYRDLLINELNFKS